MNFPLNKILISFQIILFASCSSGSRNYLDNAKKYYDAQLYQKALTELGLGVAKYPRDADLNIALAKTRNKVYEIELLKIRDTRAGGDPIKALEQVREVDKKFSSWNMQSDLNGSDFRKNQISALFFDYKNLLSRELQKDHIIKTLIELRKFRDILGPLKDYEAFEKEIITKGQQKCQYLQGGNYRFFTLFISKYCEYFHAPAYDVTDFKDELFSVGEYEVVVDRSEVKNPANFLSNSKLFHPNSPKVIKVKANISFDYKETKRTLKKEKNYREQVYYTETVKESYFVPEPYWTTELVCNYLDKFNPCKNQKVQKTRMATRWRDKKVRRSKYVDRTFRYSVEEIAQTLLLRGKANLFVGNMRIPVDLSKKEVHVDYWHNHNHRLAGVSPKQLSKKDVSHWKEAFLLGIGERLKEVIVLDWEKRHCRWEGSNEELNEKFAKCFFATTKNPFLDEWSQNFGNISFSDLEKELRL